VDVAAKHDVVEDSHAAEQGNILKGTGDPQRGDCRRARAADVDAVEGDRPGVRA